MCYSLQENSTFPRFLTQIRATRAAGAPSPVGPLRDGSWRWNGWFLQKRGSGSRRRMRSRLSTPSIETAQAHDSQLFRRRGSRPDQYDKLEDDPDAYQDDKKGKT